MASDPVSSTGDEAVPDRVPTVDQAPETGAFPTLGQGIGWLDRRFGPAWSVRALRACFGFALVSCWVAYFLGWGLGGSGRLGNVRLLADPEQPARLVGALSAIAFPAIAMAIGRALGRLERRSKLKLVRWWRRKPKQYRTRLRLLDFERRYRWLLGVVFGAALIAVLIWYRRGDVAAFAIVFSWLALGPVSGIAMARRFKSPTSQGLAALFAGFGSISGAVLLILAFAGAGVSAFAFAILGITNVAFAGALGVLLEIVMGGALTLGIALAGAGVATVALALAGAGTGIATLTGVATMSRAGLAAFLILMSGATVATLAFEEAAVLSAAIGGISALAVAAAVSHNRMGRHGAYAGAIGSIALLTLGAVLFGWGDRPLVMFAACFFFLLPFALGLVGWGTFSTIKGLMGWLIRGGRGWSSLLAGWLVAGAITVLFSATLAFLLGYIAESYNQLTLIQAGRPAFAALPTIDRAVAAPLEEGLWLFLLLSMPIAPFILITAFFATDGLLALQPIDYRLRVPLFRMLGLILALAMVILPIWLAIRHDDVEIARFFGQLGEEGVFLARSAWQTSP